MNGAIREKLLSLVGRDLRARERLAADESLFDGYHPEMQAIHEENAAALDTILSEHGWPTSHAVGEDAAEAAWLIAQHAIALPDFQRSCLAALEAAAARGEVPRWQAAMLADRIRVFEGRPQVYGTSFDWDKEGRMSPLPIEDPDQVDERRADAGLPPLAVAVERHRADAAAEPTPQDLGRRQQQFDEWARKVGWRS